MRRILVGLVLGVIALTCLLTLDSWAEKGGTEPTSPWRIKVSLDVPALSPPAVQWTVLEEDPTPGYKERLKKIVGIRTNQPTEGDKEAQKRGMRLSQMKVGWDLGFRKVTGDEVYLLTSGPGVQHSLTSNSAAGKKWLVSKVRQIDGRPVCWCLPIEVKHGTKIEVALTDKNMFDLETPLDELLKE